MLTATKTKPKLQKERFAEDGTRLFNPSLPHGVVYADGYSEAKFIQEWEGREVLYQGNHLPVGHKPGQPLPRPVDEIEQENQDLHARLASLEQLVKQLTAAQAATTTQPAPTGDTGQPPGKPAGAPKNGK